MKTNRIKILAVLIIVMLTILACGFNFSTAKITDAKMTANPELGQATSTFSQDQTFYCIVTLQNAPEDTKIKAVWTAVNVEGEQPNLLIDQAEITAGNESTFTFNLQNNGLWPKGNYKVDLYLNDNLDRTLEFEVQ
ncbi:MAG: hypothetical protein WHV66_06930 [Anaerolineales bacterium]